MRNNSIIVITVATAVTQAIQCHSHLQALLLVQNGGTEKRLDKATFHHVSRDKILHDYWSILAAVSRGFYDATLNAEKGLGTG